MGLNSLLLEFQNNATECVYDLLISFSFFFSISFSFSLSISLSLSFSFFLSLSPSLFHSLSLSHSTSLYLLKWNNWNILEFRLFTNFSGQGRCRCQTLSISCGRYKQGRDMKKMIICRRHFPDSDVLVEV